MFTVETDALRLLANDLAKFAASAGSPGAGSYTNTQVMAGHTSDGSLVYANVDTSTEALKNSIADLYAQIHDALDGSASELRKTALSYDGLDDDTRRSLDALFPDSPGTRRLPDSGVAPGTSIPCPAAPSGTPPSSIPGDLMTVIFTTDWLSPSTTVSLLIGQLFGWDPLSETGKRFAGDWSAIDRVSGALTELADYQSNLASAISKASETAFDSWTGKAADAAEEYFGGFVSKARKAADQLRSASKEYKTLAIGMKAGADFLSGNYASIMDALLVAAIAFAAGTATAETGVGLLLGWGASAIAASRVLWLVREAWQILMQAETVWQVFTTAIGGAQNALLTTKISIRIPHSYDNSQV